MYDGQHVVDVAVSDWYSAIDVADRDVTFRSARISNTSAYHTAAMKS